MKIFIISIFSLTSLFFCESSFSQDSLRRANYQKILDNLPDRGFYDSLILAKVKYYSSISAKLQNELERIARIDIGEHASDEIIESKKKMLQDIQDSIASFQDYVIRNIFIFQDSILTIMRVEIIDEIILYSQESNVRFVINTDDILYGDTTKLIDITDKLIDRLKRKCH